MTERQLSHYIIGEKIGEGGMGIVYRGVDTRLKRLVALKFLTKTLPVDAAERKRFLREARAASSVSHPNVCVIHAIEEVEGEEFIVMEFVEGQTLRQWAGRRRREVRSTHIPLPEICDIVLQIADGLSAAHRHGIVHRDVKPENVMIDPDDRVKIMDFGLAKLAGESKLTRSGATVGTVAYMSPEQVQGQEISEQTDIYSFGVLLYELLTGTVPFHAEHAVGMMYAIVSSEPRPIGEVRRGIDTELARIVMKCIARDTRSRYSTMREVMGDLKSYAEQNRTVIARTIRPASKDSRTRIQKGWAFLFEPRTLIIGLGVLFAGAIAVVFNATRTVPPAGARLTITSSPGGGHVWINNVDAGLAPVGGYLVPAGRQTVHLALSPYLPVDTVFPVIDGQAIEIRILLRLPAPGNETSGSPRVPMNPNLEASAIAPKPGAAPARAEAPATTAEGLAADLIDKLQKGAGALTGYVDVRPFTYQNTRTGSRFSRYFKSLLESRIKLQPQWKSALSVDATGRFASLDGPGGRYEITGEYWEEGSQVRFVSRLRAIPSMVGKAAAEAILSRAALTKKGISWKVGNLKQFVETTGKLGPVEPESGELRLDLRMNNGSENPLFTEGDSIKTYVRVNKPCTVRIFYYTADSMRLLLTGSNDWPINSSQVNSYVAIDSSQCTAPFGAEILQAFATEGEFEHLKTRSQGDNSCIVLQSIESAMVATRGNKTQGNGTSPVERRIVITTIPK